MSSSFFLLWSFSDITVYTFVQWSAKVGVHPQLASLELIKARTTYVFSAPHMLDTSSEYVLLSLHRCLICTCQLVQSWVFGRVMLSVGQVFFCFGWWIQFRNVVNLFPFPRKFLSFISDLGHFMVVFNGPVRIIY